LRPNSSSDIIFAEVKKMSLLKELPKEVAKEQFEEFLEKIEKDFPADQFPELFVEYQEANSRILILGVGNSNECAEQMLQAFKKDPNLRRRQSKSKMLRAPRTKFLLR